MQLVVYSFGKLFYPFCMMYVVFLFLWHKFVQKEKTLNAHNSPTHKVESFVDFVFKRTLKLLNFRFKHFFYSTFFCLLCVICTTFNFHGSKRFI